MFERERKKSGVGTEGIEGLSAASAAATVARGREEGREGKGRLSTNTAAIDETSCKAIVREHEDATYIRSYRQLMDVQLTWRASAIGSPSNGDKLS